jgi:hypothetical protein
MTHVDKEVVMIGERCARRWAQQQFRNTQFGDARLSKE